MVPIRSSTIDLDLPKSPIDLSCLFFCRLPGENLVIRQKHILVIYVGVECSNEYLMQIFPVNGL